jgi:hypothetical protein
MSERDIVLMLKCAVINESIISYSSHQQFFTSLEFSFVSNGPIVFLKNRVGFAKKTKEASLVGHMTFISIGTFNAS